MLESLKILGLRGFATEQTIRFAIPNGKPGSGLTTIVGANNTGKSTAIEALRALAQSQPPTFTQGRRNLLAGDRITLTLAGRADDEAAQGLILKSIDAGGSETEIVQQGTQLNRKKLFVLPSRRVFSPYFGHGSVNRDNFMDHIGFPTQRSSSVDQFTNRLFTIQKNKVAFNAVLKRVVDPPPDWIIDQSDTGQHYLKLFRGDVVHSSEGLGEGLVSLLYIIDALYDSKPGQFIAIDEPELSLHPALQRKLAALFSEYARDRQILCATHSPYFVSLDGLESGATVARTHLVDGQSRVSQLSAEIAAALARLLRDQNNPHLLGLNAQEVFFLEDHVILVEGQEDVVFYKRIQSLLGEGLKGEFFGWGVGGAEKMGTIAQLLLELGFTRVVGILDRNKAHLVPKLQATYPAFHFLSIAADDVRSKAEARARAAVAGLLDDDNKALRPEYEERTRAQFQEANKYLRGDEQGEAQ